MELEELRSEYRNNDNPKGIDELKEMGRAKGHPVLKRIRLQLIIESVLWAILLSVYYTGFDGHQKPVLWNVILIVSIVLLLLHNVLGYRLARSPINGQNLAESLRRYAYRVKRYARISIATRVIAIMAILSFFASSVIWNETKIIMASLFVLVLLSLQIFFLWKLWKGRISIIENQIRSLEEPGPDND